MCFVSLESASPQHRDKIWSWQNLELDAVSHSTPEPHNVNVYCLLPVGLWLVFESHAMRWESRVIEEPGPDGYEAPARRKVGSV